MPVLPADVREAGSGVHRKTIMIKVAAGASVTTAPLDVGTFDDDFANSLDVTSTIEALNASKVATTALSNIFGRLIPDGDGTFNVVIQSTAAVSLPANGYLKATVTKHEYRSDD